MKVLMAGGNGHVGAALRRRLEPHGWNFTILTRRPVGPQDIAWDGKTLGAWTKAVEGADVLINLAGRSVNCRYTGENLNQMMYSRVDSTGVLGEAIRQASKPPWVWLQASTATIYAHRFDAPNDELTGIIGGDEPNAPYKWNVSISIAKAWEMMLEEAETPATRKVAMRSAMTMSVDKGSVFDVFATLARRGLGGQSGNGRQYVSWIHEEDFANAVRFLVEREDLSGPVNISSPHPLPNAEFMRILRESVGAKFSVPLPAWLLELGAVFMRTETELILKSRRVIPTRLLQSGFTFRYPDWESASRELALRWGST